MKNAVPKIPNWWKISGNWNSCWIKIGKNKFWGSTSDWTLDQTNMFFPIYLTIVGTIGNTYGSGSWNSWEQLSGTYRVRHHSSWSKFCRNSRCRHVAMFSCNMASYSIISCKSPGAIGTRNTDTLMSLANVGAEIGFITIGTLTKWTFKFRAWKIKQTIKQKFWWDEDIFGVEKQAQDN